MCSCVCMWITTLYKHAIEPFEYVVPSQYFIICNFLSISFPSRFPHRFIFRKCVCQCECMHMCSIRTQSLTFPHISIYEFHGSDYQHFQTSIQFHLPLFLVNLFIRSLQTPFPSRSSYFIFQKVLIHVVSFLIESYFAHSGTVFMAWWKKKMWFVLIKRFKR